MPNALGLGIPDIAYRRAGAAVTGPLLSIDANGWQANYNGAPPSTILNTAMTATGVPGYNSTGGTTTYSVPFRITKRLRDPGLVSLQATKVGLSYKLPLGASVAGCTNNSTQVSPPPVANWVTRFNTVIDNGDRIVDIVAGHYYAGIVAGEQVACVEVTMTDGTTTLTQKTSTTIDISGTGDAKTVWGYRVTFPAASVATLNNGQITYNAKVYPFIGVAASIADSADYVARGLPITKFAPRYDVKDPTRKATPWVCYLSTTGNDSTGIWNDVPATALASPFLTAAGALEASKIGAIGAGAVIPSGHVDGCEIRAGVGTFDMPTIATAVPAKGAGIIFTRDTASTTRANAIYQVNVGYRPRLGQTGLYTNMTGVLTVSDCSYIRTGTSQLTGDTQFTLLEFVNVNFNGGTKTTTNGNSQTNLAFWGGTVITGLPASNVSALGVANGRGVLIYRGVSITANGCDLWGYNVIGCAFSAVGVITVQAGNGTQDNATICYNISTGDTSITLGAGSDQNVNGYLAMGNVFEWTTITTNPVWRVSGDSAIGSTNHILEYQNTYAGANDCGRHNDRYVDSDTPAGSPIRTHTWQRSQNNIKVQDNSKHDLFTPANAARIGGWETYLGCGYDSNFVQFIDAGTGSFAREYQGPNSTVGTSNTVILNPRFKNPQCTTVAAGPVYTAGAGSGDYRLQRISEGNAFDSPCLTGASVQLLPGYSTVLGAYP